MTARNDRRITMFEEAQSSEAGKFEMAAARASVKILDLLHRALTASGLRQKDLAQSLSVTEGRISQVFGGDGNLRINTVARVLRASGYELVVSARPAQEGMPELRTRPRSRSQQTVHVTYGEVTAATAEGVGPEPVLVLSLSHSDDFLGDVHPSQDKPVVGADGWAAATPRRKAEAQ